METPAIAPAHLPGLSTVTPRLREDMLTPAARAVFAREHSATTGMARRQRASLHAAAPALAREHAVAAAVVDVAAAAAEEDMAAVGTGNRIVIVSRPLVKT